MTETGLVNLTQRKKRNCRKVIIKPSGEGDNMWFVQAPFVPDLVKIYRNTNGFGPGGRGYNKLFIYMRGKIKPSISAQAIATRIEIDEPFNMNDPRFLGYKRIFRKTWDLLPNDFRNKSLWNMLDGTVLLDSNTGNMIPQFKKFWIKGDGFWQSNSALIADREEGRKLSFILDQKPIC